MPSPRPRPKPNPRAAILLAAILALAPLAACSGPRRAAREPRSPMQVSVIEQRIDAVIGRTLVIPVKLDGPIAPNKPIPARLDDGRKLSAPLYWVSVSPDPAQSNPADPDSAGSGWLPLAGRWSATPAAAATRPSAAGAWVLVIELPRDSIGQAVWIGGHRTILNWLPDPGHVQAAGQSVPWRAPLGDEPISMYLLRMAEPELLSPVRRWRYRLLTAGLAPDRSESLVRPRTPPPPTPPAPPPYEDPVLEALARQHESRWQVALAMLWLADADLAERVKRRLVASVDFGQGVVAPAWPTEQLALDTLLTDLLNPRLSPAQRAERAAAWLDALPAAAAWVIDDAGLRDAITGRNVATCGVANLTERATLAWTTVGEHPGTPDLVPLPSLAARHLVALQPPPQESTPAPAAAAQRPTPVNIHAGRWTASAAVALGALPAAPPGLRIEPLLGDWTMPAWLRGIPDPGMVPTNQWAAAGLVHRRPSEQGGSAWWLYLECRAPDDPALRDSLETLRVYMGPSGSPSAILRISSDGSAIDEAAQGRGGPIPGASITRQPGRWVAQVPIPTHAIEPDGALRLGLSRLDSRGRRTAWPRPMLPWQAEPGRAAIDTSAWVPLQPASPAPTPSSATR